MVETLNLKYTFRSVKFIETSETMFSDAQIVLISGINSAEVDLNIKNNESPLRDSLLIGFNILMREMGCTRLGCTQFETDDVPSLIRELKEKLPDLCRLP